MSTSSESPSPHSDRDEVIPPPAVTDPAGACPPGSTPSTETTAPIDADGTIRSGKLAGLGMWTAIWVCAWPVLVQQFLQAFVGMADKLFAGRLDPSDRVAALDAIGIGTYVGWFISIAMAGLGIGGQALIARGMGAGDRDLAHRALGQAMSLSVAWGCMVAAVLWFAASPMAAFAGLTPEATDFLVLYLRIIAVGMPFAGIMMVGAMCLHGAGETTWPSWIAIGVNVVNVVSSWLLSGVEITVPLGGERAFVLPDVLGLDWGVAGIAAGTAIGYTFGAVCTLLVLLRGVKDLRLDVGAMAIERTMLRRIVRIGVPNFAEGLSMWAVNLVVLSFIGTIAAREHGGEGLQGAHVIAVQWEAFSFLPGFAIGTAAATLAGQYLGAGNARMARKAILACTTIAAVGMSGLGIVYMTAGEALTRVISSEPIHLEVVPRLLFICGGVQVFFAITMVIRQGLRGVGDTTWCLLITTSSSYLIRLPATWFFGIWMGLGIEGIWYGLCGEFAVRAMLFSARFLHGGWTRIRV